MRHLAKILLILLFTSCLDTSQKDEALTIPANSKMVTTTLRDSLGSVNFLIPTRFDTTFNWTNRSDCGKPCDREEYRFQSKSNPIFKESGFYYVIPNIPIDQFTIIHSSYFPFHERKDTSKRSEGHEPFKSRLSSDPFNGQIKFDTIEKINDRYFSIIWMAGFDTSKQKYFAKVAGLTTIKGNEIEFHYDFKSKEQINENEYFNHSTRLIRTIHISNGI